MTTSLRSIGLVFPPRSLAPEIREAARSELAFLSRADAQRRAAARLGFPTP